MAFRLTRPTMWKQAVIAGALALAMVWAPAFSRAGERSMAQANQPLRDRLLEGRSFAELDREAAEVRLQILVTELDSDGSVQNHWSYRPDAEYLYPASAIKHLAAMAVFSTFPQLQPDDVVSIYSAPSPDLTDAELSRFEGRRVRQLSLREIVREALIVSGNEPYNRLVDIVGHEGLNQWLWRAGLANSRLWHRLFAFVPDEVQRMSPKVVVRRDGQTLLELPARRSRVQFPESSPQGIRVGRAWRNDDTRSVVQEAMDFTGKNEVPIGDLHRAMLGLAFPFNEGAAKIDLTPQAREFLLSVMAELPEGPADRGFELRADRYKPMLPGLRRVMPMERIEYVNKAGRAYGFHIESAWIRDKQSGRSVIVSAGLYVNSDGVLNDDRYDYHRSYAFFQELGEWVARRLVE